MGFRYIIMEKISGQNLHYQWPLLSTLEKRNVIQQIINILSQLQSIRFTTIGGILPDGTTGSYFPLEKGPFNRIVDWYKFMLKKSLETQQSNPVLSPLSRFNDQAIGILQDIENQHLSKLECIPIVMFHGDFAFRNMLVDSGKLTGIIDWEWAGAFPVDHEWSSGDIFFDDATEEDKALINEELEKSGIMWWRNIPYCQNRKLLVQSIENLAPWTVGCFSEAQDIEFVRESEEILSQNITKLLLPEAWK